MFVFPPFGDQHKTLASFFLLLSVPSHAWGRLQLLRHTRRVSPKRSSPGPRGSLPHALHDYVQCPVTKRLPDAAGPCPPWPSCVALATLSHTGCCISFRSVSPVLCHVSGTHTEGPSGHGDTTRRLRQLLGCGGVQATAGFVIVVVINHTFVFVCVLSLSRMRRTL